MSATTNRYTLRRVTIFITLSQGPGAYRGLRARTVYVRNKWNLTSLIVSKISEYAAKAITLKIYDPNTLYTLLYNYCFCWIF